MGSRGETAAKQRYYWLAIPNAGPEDMKHAVSLRSIALAALTCSLVIHAAGCLLLAASPLTCSRGPAISIAAASTPPTHHQ